VGIYNRIYQRGTGRNGLNEPRGDYKGRSLYVKGFNTYGVFPFIYFYN